nr:RNA polymerase II subunit F [Cryptomonas sp.]
MDYELFNLDDFNKNEIMPLFTDEVYSCLTKRNRMQDYLEKDKLIFNEKNRIVYEKTFEYVRMFSKLDEKKILAMRKFIDNITVKNDQKNEHSLEIQFVICKIVDLMPTTLEEISVLIPRFAKFFNFKDGKSIIKKISSIIESDLLN